MAVGKPVSALEGTGGVHTLQNARNGSGLENPVVATQIPVPPRAPHAQDLVLNGFLNSSELVGCSTEEGQRVIFIVALVPV